MRLLHRSITEEGKTELKVNVSTIEDLWHLFNLILPGDIVRAKTYRKVAKDTAIGKGATDKMVMNLNILVEDIDFDPLGELRFKGTNQSMHDMVRLGAYHTLSIRVDTPQDVKIFKKEWDAVMELRLREACDAEGNADTAAVVLDYGIAHVCIVTPALIITKAKIELSIAKKHKANGSSRDDSIAKFFGLVYDAVLSNVDFEKIKVMLVCSPGTIREEFKTFMSNEAAKNRLPSEKALLQFQSKILTVRVSNSFKGAIREAMSNEAVAKAMDLTKGLDGIKAWEAFQRLITEYPDRCVYTAQYVAEAIRHEAVERLLVSDDVFQGGNVLRRRFFIALCEKARSMGAEVVVLTVQHASGEQLSQMSGIAATLRFEVPELDAIEPNPNFMTSEHAAALIREHHAMLRESSSSGMGSPSQSKSAM